jgi:hypothetical protein
MRTGVVHGRQVRRVGNRLFAVPKPEGLAQRVHSQAASGVRSTNISMVAVGLNQPQSRWSCLNRNR